MRLEVLATSKNATDQNGSINRRNFRVPDSFASVYIREVVEKAAMRWQLLPQETQGCERPVACISRRYVTIPFPNAQSSQAKTRCSDTRDNTVVARANIRAILN